jgi:hypothetical protein
MHADQLAIDADRRAPGRESEHRMLTRFLSRANYVAHSSRDQSRNLIVFGDDYPYPLAR